MKLLALIMSMFILTGSLIDSAFAQQKPNQTKHKPTHYSHVNRITKIATRTTRPTSTQAKKSSSKIKSLTGVTKKHIVTLPPFKKGYIKQAIGLQKAVSLPSSIVGNSELSIHLNRILQQVPSNVDIGVYVKSMQRGDNLFVKNESRSFAPASTLKVLTAEAALIYLGPEYRFPTQVLTDAKTVSNGVLQGNIYIVQSGDPSLTYFDLADLMMNLKNRQIQAISGNVYIDNTAYDQTFHAPGWLLKDKQYCYGAPISASIINKNCLSLQLTPSKSTGSPAQVLTSTRYYYPQLNNKVVTITPRSRSCSLRLNTEENSSISLEGCMPRGGSVWGVSYVLQDIPGYNLSLFRDLMRQLGISVYGRIQPGKAPPNSAVLALHHSKQLNLLVIEMLKKSDNIIAGTLLKKLGQQYYKQPGSWENGARAVTQILSEHAHMNTYGIKVIDGSGLSIDNRVTPIQMMQVIDFAYHNSSTNNAFITALPISGIDGTLKHRLVNIARKVYAKTGTLPLQGVASMAGYVTTADKEHLAFVIMINGKGSTWKYKQIEDSIITALTKYTRNGY